MITKLERQVSETRSWLGQSGVRQKSWSRLVRPSGRPRPWRPSPGGASVTARFGVCTLKLCLSWPHAPL